MKIGLKPKLSKIFLTLTITFLFTAFLIVPSHLAAAQSDAVTSAQNTLTACYKAAEQAEAAGANITSLQDTLNTAGRQLTKAQYAQSQGDMDSANSYSQQVQSTLNGFAQKADALRISASQQAQQNFQILVASIVGTFAVIGCSIAVWFIVKRKNQNRGDVETVES